MKKVYSAQDTLIVGNLRNLLVNEGIESEIRTPFLAAASGDVPFTECWSQIWIVNDEDLDRARKLIDAALAEKPEAKPPWKCPNCGEEIEGQYEACWQCGSARMDQGV